MNHDDCVSTNWWDTAAHTHAYQGGWWLWEDDPPPQPFHLGGPHGMTPDQGLARLREAEKITDPGDRWTAYLRVLSAVRQLGYRDGGDDQRWDDVRAEPVSPPKAPEEEAQAGTENLVPTACPGCGQRSRLLAKKHAGGSVLRCTYCSWSGPGELK